MSDVSKKMLVLLPVVVLGLFYFHDHSALYRHVSGKRLLLLGISLLLLYGWMLAEVMFTRQQSLYQVSLQGSFYVYIFMVLTLTGYFILFREVSVHHWWQRMVTRVARRDHVNFVLFKIFHIYKISDLQIVGNVLMLLPLGIYLPLRYKRLQHFFAVALVACLVSITIETLQLVTSFRSTDVDDVLLNTTGACIGYALLRMVQLAARSFRPASSVSALA